MHTLAPILSMDSCIEEFVSERAIGGRAYLEGIAYSGHAPEGVSHSWSLVHSLFPLSFLFFMDAKP